MSNQPKSRQLFVNLPVENLDRTVAFPQSFQQLLRRNRKIRNTSTQPRRKP